MTRTETSRTCEQRASRRILLQEDGADPEPHQCEPIHGATPKAAPNAVATPFPPLEVQGTSNEMADDRRQGDP